MPSIRYRWVIVILSHFGLLVFAFNLQSLPPILTLVIENLKLTHAEAGLLMSLFFLPAIFLGISAGYLSDRLGPLKIGSASFILLIIGTLIFATSSTFFFAALGRVIAGIGGITLNIVSIQILSRWFRGREIGTATGIYNTAMPIGTIISLTTFGALAESWGWRMPIFITMMISIVGLIAFLVLYKPALVPSQRTKTDKEERITGLFSNLMKIGVSMWLVGFCWMLFNASVISFLTFAPDFFILKGYSIGYAGFLASLLMWGAFVLSPMLGRLVDKVGNNDVFIMVGSILIAGAIYLVTKSTNYLFPMIVMAVAVPFLPVAVLSLPSKILKYENLGLGLGILYTVNGIGMVFGPYVTGLVRDKTGSYEMSFICLSVIAILMTVVALFLRSKIKTGNISV
ncbi:nitrate/nitrite transporter [Chloroflexota bacterium]